VNTAYSIQSCKDREESISNGGNVVVDNAEFETEAIKGRKSSPTVTATGMDWRDNNDINSSNSIIMAKERTPTVVVDDIVIILNTNARGVTDDLVDAANDIVQEMKKRNNYNKIDKNENYNNTDIRFMVTSTLEDAQIATKDIINSSSKKKKKKILIIPVGGDGTLTSVINLLWKEHIRSNKANNNNKNDNFPFIFGYSNRNRECIRVCYWLSSGTESNYLRIQ